MAEEKNLIEITHISKKFGDLTVLKDISVKVKEKEVVVIIGPSGSGKSTLLRCINGLETPTTGSITFDGVPVNGEKNINEVRTEVGMVFQRFNLFPHMSVIQNLMLAPMKVRKISKKEAYDRGMQLLKKVGMEDKADYKPPQLSGGQRQRIAIARAILKNPKILILDEATSALDTESEKIVQDALDKLMVGRTSFVIAHRLSTIFNADQIYVIDNGHIKEHGTHEELLKMGGLYSYLYNIQFNKKNA